MWRLDALFTENFNHVFSAITLGVLFTTVADQRNIEEIPCIVRHIIHAPQLLLIPHRILVRRQLLVTLHIRKTRTGVHTGPMTCMVRPHVPRSRASHAESSQRNPVLIHMKTSHRIIPALKNVGLTCRLPTVAIATKGVNHDRALRLKLTRLLRHQSAVNKTQIRRCIPPSVEPDPHRHLLSLTAPLQPLRDLHAVRLRAPVDLGVEAQDLLPTPHHPRRLTEFKRLDSIPRLLK